MYGGEHCQYPVCFHVLGNSGDVCSQNGLCVAPNTCLCSAGHTHSQCEIPLCFGIAGNDTEACTGHGACSSPDVCLCEQHYSGLDCSTKREEGCPLLAFSQEQDDVVSLVPFFVREVAVVSLPDFLNSGDSKILLTATCSGFLGNVTTWVNDTSSLSFQVPYLYWVDGTSDSRCFVSLKSSNESCERTLNFTGIVSLNVACSKDASLPSLSTDSIEPQERVENDRFDIHISQKNFTLTQESDIVRMAATISFIADHSFRSSSSIRVECDGEVWNVDSNSSTILIEKELSPRQRDLYVEEYSSIFKCYFDIVPFPVFCHKKTYRVSKEILLEHENARTLAPISTTVARSQTVLSIFSIFGSVLAFLVFAVQLW